LARIMLALNTLDPYTGEPTGRDEVDLAAVGRLALDLGVELKEGAPEEAAAAIAMWLFDGTVESLPGGYSANELSPDSPLKEFKVFPQELVMVGRNTVLIKGVAARLGLKWSLAKAWVPIATRLLFEDEEEKGVTTTRSDGAGSRLEGVHRGDGRGRGRAVQAALRRRRKQALAWGQRRGSEAALRLPGPVRRRVAAAVLSAIRAREAWRETRDSKQKGRKIR